MIDPTVLQWGALGVGFAILVYTADALRRELAREKPRAEGRNLILMFMAFSLVHFGFATFLEIHKDTEPTKFADEESQIGQDVSGIDANLGGKYVDVINSISSHDLKCKL